MADYEESSNLDYIDDKEFQSKFLLSPDIQDDADFKHLDKNLAITNLKYEKNGINEPDQARAILRGLHVLNNNKYFKIVRIPVLDGYKEEKEGDVIVKRPVFKYVEKQISKFPKTFHSLKSEFYSFVNTSASRQGHRIRAAQTRRSVREESIEERNQVKSRWGGSNRQPKY